jgi:hypothetical protein
MRAKRAAERAAPFLEALAALHFEADRPATWQASGDYTKGREPLEEWRKQAADVLCVAKSIHRMQPCIWIEARKRLRVDPRDKLESLRLLIDEPIPGARRVI